MGGRYQRPCSLTPWSIADPNRGHRPYSGVLKSTPLSSVTLERTQRGQATGPRSCSLDLTGPRETQVCVDTEPCHLTSDTETCLFTREAAPFWDPDLGSPRPQRSQIALGGHKPYVDSRPGQGAPQSPRPGPQHVLDLMTGRGGGGGGWSPRVPEPLGAMMEGPRHPAGREKGLPPRGTAQGRRNQKSHWSWKGFSSTESRPGRGHVMGWKPRGQGRLPPNLQLRARSRGRPPPGLDPTTALPPAAGTSGCAVLTSRGGVIAPRVFRGHSHQSWASQAGPRALP